MTTIADDKMKINIMNRVDAYVLNILCVLFFFFIPESIDTTYSVLGTGLYRECFL